MRGMKLYTYPGAPNPRRVHIYLAEKGIALPFERVDIMRRENRQPEFVENVNRMGGLPVLELDDGTHIAESVAICRYFEALTPEPPLFGRSAVEQAMVEMWIRRVELHLMLPVGMVWVHGSPLTRAVVGHQIAEMAEQSRKQAERQLRFLDRELAERRFLAGSDYSMADIVALCTIDFAVALNGFELAPSERHLRRWHEEVSARPGSVD
jgi:glutathione S-transferase